MKANRSKRTCDPIKVTSPLLPTVDDLVPYLRDIFASRWVTNNGRYLQEFEVELCRRLNTGHLAVVTNGTAALDVAIRSLDIEGDVITTGYSFPATYHVLFNIPGVTPVFADIREDYTLDPDSVRAKVTDHTRAILAVHPYGYPCQVDELAKIADDYGLYLIYDGAPSFGTTLRQRSIATFGDLTTFSFHATKVFSTLEGGCIVAQSEKLINTVKRMRNFGIERQEEVVLTGVNAKMDEVRAVIGLVTLSLVEGAIDARKRVVERYIDAFRAYPCEEIIIRHEFYQNPDIRLNYAYFPILIRPSARFSRDTLYTYMRDAGIEVRKYYSPSVTEIPLYQSSIEPGELETTRYASQNVLCLPVHHELSDEACDRVIDTLLDLYAKTH